MQRKLEADGYNEKVAESSPALKIVLVVLKLLEKIDEFTFSRSLYVAATLTGFLIMLPVVAVWSVFLFAHYLPPPFGALLIWTMVFFVVILVAAVDYVQTS